VAERDQRPVQGRDGDEAAEASPRDVLEEHPLDRIAAAELEDLV
jgi:hypothetical protein